MSLSNLREFNLSNNNISYFSFQALQRAICTGKVSLTHLNLENTRLDERNAIELLKVILSHSKVKVLNFSRNMNLSSKFSAYALYLFKNVPSSYELREICLEYTSVS